MHIRRWVLTPLVIALVIIAAVSLAPVLAQQQQPPKVDKKTEQGQKFDIQQVVNAADAAKAGTVASDIAGSFRFDFLKAQEGRTYVPFTVTIVPDQMPASRMLNMFVRVVNKAPDAAAAGPGRCQEGQQGRQEPAQERAPRVRVPGASSSLEPAGGGAGPAVPLQPRLRGAGRRVRRLRRAQGAPARTT